MISIKLPLWLRLVLLVGVVILASGAGLFAYRYYTHPVTLTVAVGSIDGEAANAMSAIASQLVSTNASVRLKVVDTGTVLEAGKAYLALNQRDQANRQFERIVSEFPNTPWADAAKEKLGQK